MGNPKITGQVVRQDRKKPRDKTLQVHFFVQEMECFLFGVLATSCTLRCLTCAFSFNILAQPCERESILIKCIEFCLRICRTCYSAQGRGSGTKKAPGGGERENKERKGKKIYDHGMYRQDKGDGVDVNRLELCGCTVNVRACNKTYWHCLKRKNKVMEAFPAIQHHIFGMLSLKLVGAMGCQSLIRSVDK